MEAKNQRAMESEQRRRELADFLRTRREKLKPEAVGIKLLSRRRTPGLRREEVAELAGVGTTWYTWLEQARDIQPSAEVLHRLGQALRLTPAEIRHIFTLAGKAPPAEIDVVSEAVPSNINRILQEALASTPALVLGLRWDVLATNQKADETFPSLKDYPPEKKNWLYYVLCTEGPRAKIKDWESHARRMVGQFRASLGESLDDPWVLEFVEMLKSESREFAQWWREHDVRDYGPAIVEFEHPEYGVIKVERSLLRVPENPRLKLLIFTKVESGS